MIKAALFDYGGVLSEGGKVGGIAEALGAIYDVDPKTILIADIHEKFLRGEMDEKLFFEELNKRYGHTKTADATLFNARNQHFVIPSGPVFDLAAKLRGAGIKTGVLSNIYSISAHQLRQSGLLHEFDPVVVSAEEHLAKPDPAFFERALQKLNLPANEVLFIDDQQRCMPPKEMGIHTILATSPEQIVHDVKELMLKENNLELE